MIEGIKDIIKQLKKQKIGFFDVPEELRTDKSIVDIERKLGLRKTGRRGYDVITDSFFVEETVKFISDGEIKFENICTCFSDFSSYYLFLNGDIYENSSYYQMDFSSVKESVDIKKMSNEALGKITIDDYQLEASKEELEYYNQAEHIKIICKKWVKKFNACNTYMELIKNIKNYEKSKISNIIDIRFFLFQYIFEDIYNKNRFNVIMEFISNEEYIEYYMIKAICLIYNPEEVISAYHYCADSKQTNYRYKKKIKEYINSLKDRNIVLSKFCYFDSKTHYYCEETSWNDAKVYRYFETFEMFLTYRKGDLTNCDLSNVLRLNFDLTNCKIDSTTKLPFSFESRVTYRINKMYDNGKYIIKQRWYDSNKNIIKQYNHEFCYFFEFVAFLKGDLSNADLLFCNGLKNLKSITGLNLSGAKLTSEISEKWGIKYKPYITSGKFCKSFVPIIKNEKETIFALQNERELILSSEEYIKNQKIYYISDLHLIHRIKNSNCKSLDDVFYIVSKLVGNIVKELSQNILETIKRQILLIGGDTSSEFYVFDMFVKILRKFLDKEKCRIDVIFILGNHELWETPNETLNSIVDKYNSIIQEQGMYLLQNDILYKDKNNKLNRITTEEILCSEKSVLRKKMRDARIAIFGGLAFSGYNEEFNAKNGIYMKTIDRVMEVEETQKFEKLYHIITEVFSDKNFIIFTHTPKKDWAANPEPRKKFIYVNGHTHRNYFYDDGEYRIYADNQIGYDNENPKLKYFYMENEYDFFSDYNDGVYEITKEQYKDFYHGKNIQMDFNREINVLYMLKRNGYYCFIHKSKSASLSILNGGTLRKLKEKDVHYYYNNMIRVISYIHKPLDVFSKFEKQISDEIKKIGGNGNIHGCIVDIDFYNHVYVNPIDMTVTGYWAQDIIFKQVYPSVLSLLREQRPELYDKYLKLIDENDKNRGIIGSEIDCNLLILSNMYLDTDIYKASREIKKMQKLSSNILSIWCESDNCEMITQK